MSELTLDRLTEKMIEKNSVNKVYAAWSIIMWFKILDKEVPQDVINKINQEAEHAFRIENTKKYEKEYSDEKLWDKISEHAKQLGKNTLSQVLQLYYMAKSSECPTELKVAIIAALGYFIFPLDLVPDFMPLIGFGDDITILGAALAMARMYMTDEIKHQAFVTLNDLVGGKSNG